MTLSEWNLIFSIAEQKVIDEEGDILSYYNQLLDDLSYYDMKICENLYQEAINFAIQYGTKYSWRPGFLEACKMSSRKYNTKLGKIFYESL